MFQEDGLAIALDRDKNACQITGAASELPDGFSVCRINLDETGLIAEFQYAAVAPTDSRADLLKTKWVDLHLEYKWRRDAKRRHMLSLDIESDGAEIWEIALHTADGTESYAARRPIAHDVQRNVSQLLVGRILVGHNILEWDLPILHRQGIQLPPKYDTWDTLQKEQELCKARPRTSYALQGAHNASDDAREVLELARNQWLRKKAPPEVAKKAWDESDRFFITPAPLWVKNAPECDTAHNSWETLRDVFAKLDEAAITNEVKGVKWRCVPSPFGKGARPPFNPASPKRIDYWYRLLPAVAAASEGRHAAVLFVQYAQEINLLVDVLPGAFTGDTRRCARRLEKYGGLLVLQSGHWEQALSEGLPKGTVLILEKMPETLQEPAEEGTGEPEYADPRDDEDHDDDLGDAVEDEIWNRRAGLKERPVPDLYALAKMTLWQRQESNYSFVCLDARLWSRRRSAIFTIDMISCDWREVVPREQLERAGFRQTRGSFDMKDDWEKEIVTWFNIRELHPFQRAKLTKILPRQDISFEYVERATGGANSLIFQAAGLYRGLETGRLTVVISPLRALIHDQVRKLHSLGFALDVEALSGDMNRDDIDDAYRRIAGGETTMVYTAPERFRSAGFLNALETRLELDTGGEPEFWVFDEAHCISLWGLEFRPDYRKAAAYIRKRNKDSGATAAPVLLVSATLTRLAKDDIEKVLGYRP